MFRASISYSLINAPSELKTFINARGINRYSNHCKNCDMKLLKWFSNIVENAHKCSPKINQFYEFYQPTTKRNKMQKALSNATACRCDSLWSITFTETQNNLQFMWFVYLRLITYSTDITRQKRDARFDVCIHHEVFSCQRKDEWWLIDVIHTKY